MFLFDPTFILIIPVLILSFYAQSKVKNSYNKFNKVKSSTNLTGAEAAEKILNRNGVSNITIKKIGGTLTDHFDPRSNVVSLSEEVYNKSTVSSISIAAHEIGHVLQHQTDYTPIKIRSAILPVASFGSKAAFPLFLIGFLFQTRFLMDLGIIFFAGALLFHLVTLPVEFNASHRAYSELSNGILVRENELRGTKKVLNAAALTYVASTLMALVQLLRLIILRGYRE